MFFPTEREWEMMEKYFHEDKFGFFFGIFLSLVFPLLLGILIILNPK